MLSMNTMLKDPTTIQTMKAGFRHQNERCAASKLNRAVLLGVACTHSRPPSHPLFRARALFLSLSFSVARICLRARAGGGRGWGEALLKPRPIRTHAHTHARTHAHTVLTYPPIILALCSAATHMHTYHLDVVVLLLYLL